MHVSQLSFIFTFDFKLCLILFQPNETKAAFKETTEKVCYKHKLRNFKQKMYPIYSLNRTLLNLKDCLSVIVHSIIVKL